MCQWRKQDFLYLNQAYYILNPKRILMLITTLKKYKNVLNAHLILLISKIKNYISLCSKNYNFLLLPLSSWLRVVHAPRGPEQLNWTVFGEELVFYPRNRFSLSCPLPPAWGWKVFHCPTVAGLRFLFSV